MKKFSCMLLSFLLILPTLLGVVTVPVSAVEGTAETADVTATPHAYAPGLSAWYDGVQNTRAGHKDDVTVWEDLIGENNFTLKTDDKNHFTSDGFALDSSRQYLPDAIRDLVNGDAFTVEIRLGEFTSLGSAYNTFMNSDNDNFALFRRNSNDNLEFKWAGVAAGQRPMVADGLACLQNGLVSITYEVGGEVIVYINGVRAAAYDCHTGMGADTLFIGHNEDTRNFRTVYKSLRFYNRALSETDIRRNAAVDGYLPVKDLYVEDGLVALYSGMRNTRNGYDAASKVWEDLAGQNDLPLNLDDKNYFTREGLHLNSQKHVFPQTILDTVNGNAFTVEMALGDLIPLGHSFNTFINSTNDNFSLFRRASNNVLEFKFAGNAGNERPTVPDGDEAFNRNLVTVTYEVGGKTTIYINGEKVAEAASPRAMGADDLFLGHPDDSRNYDTTFRSVRFYSRALTAEEVKRNALADGVVNTALPDRPASPGYVEIAQPRTNIVGDIALVRSVDSSNEMDKILSGATKPAAVILRINKQLNITDKGGKTLFSLDDALTALDWKIMPVFELADAAAIEPLVEYLRSIRFSDCFFMSKDAELVKAAREALPTARGIIDYTETYKGKTGLTREECIALRKSMKINNGTVALLPQSAARNETVQYLYDSIINVWVRADDKSTASGRMDALLSGAVGIVSDETEELFAAATALPENTMTRVPLNIGHRGLPDGNPENTVEGSLLAYEAGADVIENDVYLTSDGHVVVMHDGTTGRTCDKNLSVTGSTLAQLKELYVNKGFENVEGKNNWRIPTLEEYLIAFKDKDCRIFIELKSDQNKLVEAVRDLVNKYEMYDQISIITFHESQMANMRKYWPEMSVGALCGGYLGEATPDSDMRNVMSFIGKYNATLNPSYSGYGENAIRAALIRGISIYPWTFAGSNYNSYFTWGYSGLTGNTAQTLKRNIKSLSVTGMTSGETVSVGESKTLKIEAESYQRTVSDVHSYAKIVFLAGEDLVKLNGSDMTFTGVGDVSFYITYTNTRAQQTVASQPITVHVTGQAVESSSETESATQEPVSDTGTGTSATDVPSTDVTATDTAATDATTGDGKSQGGCRSSLAGGLLLTLLTVPAVLTARRKREQN